MARNEELHFTVSADDQASDVVDDVADKVDDLESTKAVVKLDADSDKAVDGIGDVSDSAKALIERNPWVAEVLADTAAAKTDLESLQSKLVETGDKADDTSRHIDRMGQSEGPRLAGNQVADLTGPFGEASSAASDFGGVFDGLADISEKVAAKVGLNAAAMASAISGIGFVVAGAAAAWGIWKQKQEEARKKAAEHLKIQTELVDAVKDGNKEVASQKFIELYGKVIDLGHKAGLSTNEIVDAIRGVGDAVPDATAKMDDLQAKIDDLAAARDTLAQQPTTANWAQELTNLSLQIDQLEKQRDALKGAADEYTDLSDKQQATADLQTEVESALGISEQALNDQAHAAENAKEKTDRLQEGLSDLAAELDIQRAAEDFDADINEAMNNVALGVGATREEIRGIQDDVIRAAEQTNQNPIVVATTLQKIQAGDLGAVKSDVESWYKNHPVGITAKLSATIDQSAGAYAKAVGKGGTASGNMVVNETINVNLPRGARHSDIARAMNRSTRRSGHRYGTPQVHYARR